MKDRTQTKTAQALEGTAPTLLSPPGRADLRQPGEAVVHADAEQHDYD
jgi:hypothetical protein